ncbi:site-specific integrase [Enterococcus raffinosus]|uniref:tyrosine-type recombinase/integrase n=1 Tax=Enterococcus raffinosus TaxID=71452 RepID=UPI001C11A50F|nr:site-specific integrase [Enterococcus raffinosus]MBU5362544.1 site-specific integrase [Enterococcus raffinosus]
MRRGENIYRRKDGRWEGRYVKGRSLSGKIKYGYVYAHTLKEVREKLYPLKIQYQTYQKVRGISSIYFEEWSNYWLHMIRSEVKPATYSNYCYKLRNYVIPIIGEIPLNELTEVTGQKLLNALLEKNLKKSTIQVIFRIVIQCLNEAKRKSHINENSFSTIKLPKEKKRKVRALSRKEQLQLEKTALAEKKGNGIPTVLSLHTGLRIGEIAALRWNDIDFERKLIQITHTYQRISLSNGEQRTQLVFDSSKTDASIRLIPMSDKVRKILLSQRKISKGTFVFSSKNKPIEPRLLTYHFHRIRKKCQLLDVHFHQLRHTFATRCLEAQGDILSVSALLGHTSTQLTLDTYADSLIEARANVIYQMENKIR